MTIRSDAPRSVASLPDYVMGPESNVPPGTICTTLLIYAPFGGRLGKATFDGEPQFASL